MSILLESELFSVRVFDSADAVNVASWFSETPFDLFLVASSFTYPVSVKDIVAFASHVDVEQHKLYSVMLRSNNMHVGHFEIKNINWKHTVGTVSHVILCPDCQSKSMGKEFIDLITRIAFEVLSLDRISLSVHECNAKAIAAYEKAGYVKEGLIRDVLKYEDKRYSLYQMGILRREWREK